MGPEPGDEVQMAPLVLLGPAPLVYGFTEGEMPDGTQMVVMHIESVNGSFGFVWDAAALGRFGQACKDEAEKPRVKGLTIARQVPNGHLPDLKGPLT